MSQQLFARTGWVGKAVAAPSGAVGSLALPFDLDDEAHDDLVIKADVPKKLKKALDSGLPIISHSCVKENAERLLKWYEGVITSWRGKQRQRASRHCYILTAKRLY